jgi:hypothetical protein
MKQVMIMNQANSETIAACPTGILVAKKPTKNGTTSTIKIPHSGPKWAKAGGSGFSNPAKFAKALIL